MKHSQFLAYAFLLLTLLFSPALAEPKDSADKDAITLKVEGMSRTREYVILREFNATPEQPKVLNEQELEDGIQALKNTGLFAQVKAVDSESTASQPSQSSQPKQVTLQVKDKWTTIPIAKAKGGGGLFTFTLGIFDPNILGHALEMGGQYQNFDGEHGGVMWFRKPWFLGERLFLGGDFWLERRLDTDYFDGDSTGVIGWERRRAHLFIEKQLNSLVDLHLGLDFLQDEQSPDLFRPDEQMPAPLQAENTTITFAQGIVRFSSMKTDLFRQQGVHWEPFFEVGAGDETITRFQNDLRVLFLPHKKLNLGFKSWLGISSSDLRSHKFRLGGLEHIRGVPDGYLEGNKAALFNLESRYTLVDVHWINVQAVVFGDAAFAADSFAPDFSQEGVLAASTGGGVRIGSPKVYRLNMRLDWAQQLGGANRGIAFGLQQFF